MRYSNIKTVSELINFLKDCDPNKEILTNAIDELWEVKDTGPINPIIIEDDEAIYIMDRNQPDLREEFGD